MRRLWGGTAPAVLSVLILGCSGEQNNDVSPATDETAQTAATNDTNAKQASGPDCSKLRPVTASADETMLGLTLGMSLEEVQQRLNCAKAGYDFKTLNESKYSTPDAPAAMTLTLQAKHEFTPAGGNGQTQDEIELHFAVTTSAVSKLIKIDRTTHYSRDQRPTFSKFRSDVESKYPGMKFDNDNSSFQSATYVKSWDGQLLSKDNSLFTQCIKSESWHFDFNLNGLCGLATGVTIYRDDRSDDGGNFVSQAQFALTNPGFAYRTLKEVSALNAPAVEAHHKKAQQDAPAPEL